MGKVDGSRYIGSFSNDKYNGYGVKKWADENEWLIYSGIWKNWKMEGEGTMMYKNGSHYKGNWKSKKREGQGKMIFEDGKGYIGRWRDDNICEIEKFLGKWKRSEMSQMKRSLKRRKCKDTRRYRRQ